MKSRALIVAAAVASAIGIGQAAWAGPAMTPEAEPNGTSATATPLAGASGIAQGSVFPNADVDFYSFTAAAGDRVYSAVMTSYSASASVDSVLDLLASDGSTVIETDADDGSFGSTSSSIAGATIPIAGTYFLRVRHASATAQLRPYRLYYQVRSGAPTSETEVNDAFPGQALPAGGWVSGSTSSTTDGDFFSLNLNAGDTVFVGLDLDPERDTVEWNGQLGLGAFGTPPLVLVVNDAGAAAPDSEAFFMTVKAAGTYAIFVGLPAGGTTFGTYHLSATVFPAVAEGVNCTTYTSTNVPVTIPTGPAVATSTLTVPGTPRIADIDVELNLTHNFMADLDVELTAPGGNVVGLFSDVGSVTAGAQTTMDTVLDEEAGIPIGQFTVVQGPQFTPELNYRLSWFDGQVAGGTWTLTLRDDATGDGGTLNGWSIRVCEPLPPPACAPGFVAQTMLATDFESGAAGFTHTGTADEWELGLPATVAAGTLAAFNNCNSGASCWKTDLDNSYDASSNQDLLSPSINLAGFSGPVVVNWAQRYQMESASFDHMLIEAREAGNPSNQRTLFEWTGATMSQAVGNPTVSYGEAAGWGQFSARADSLAGLNTELRFHVDSDTTVNLAGLAIDDVTVTACRAAAADLSITKTDGVTTVVPGTGVIYTITASNPGPDPVTGATVVDNFSPAHAGYSWTCVGAGGGTCTAAGAGVINDTAVNLPVGGSVTYTVTSGTTFGATGTLVNTATVSSSVTDPNPANNSATDTDTLTPEADLSVTKSDGVTTALPGGSVTYTIVASNAGPSNAVSSVVADTFPGTLTCTWTCIGGGGTCTASGSGNINDSVNLPAGAIVTYTATCTISASATGTLSNTATASSATTDPNPGNNSATDSDTLTAPSGASLSATKTVGSTFVIGSGVTYTIVISNAGPGAQADNPGNEFTDVLPLHVNLVSATASSGAAVATVGTNTVTWNGAIPASGSVTITINATLNLSTPPGEFESNQGQLSYDSDGDGTNDASGVTDDPTVAGGGNPTVFAAGGSITAIPTLSPIGLLLLGLAVALPALALLRRLRSAGR